MHVNMDYVYTYVCNFMVYPTVELVGGQPIYILHIMYIYKSISNSKQTVNQIPTGKFITALFYGVSKATTYTEGANHLAHQILPCHSLIINRVEF